MSRNECTAMHNGQRCIFGAEHAGLHETESGQKFGYVVYSAWEAQYNIAKQADAEIASLRARAEAAEAEVKALAEGVVIPRDVAARALTTLASHSYTLSAAGNKSYEEFSNAAEVVRRALAGKDGEK